MNVQRLGVYLFEEACFCQKACSSRGHSHLVLMLLLLGVACRVCLNLH